MKKRKILMVGTTDCVGGAASVGWNIGNSLIKRDWDVKFIVAYKNSDKDYVYQLKKNIFTSFLDKKTRFHVTSLLRSFLAFFFANDIDWGSKKEILNHPWYKNADIVHFHNLHGNYFKLDTLKTICKEKKVVWTLHDMWALTAHCVYCYDCGPWKMGKHHKFIWGKNRNMLWDNSDYLWNKKRDIYENCKMHVVTPSEWLYKYVKKGILKDQPSSVILNGVDTSIFKPEVLQKVRKELVLPIDKKIISFIAQGGKTDPRKGGNYLFEVAKSFENDKDILFLCVGGGTEVIREKNILYVPFIKDVKKVARYYQASDIFLHASLADNCPLTPIEALACGLPVVAFNVGGVPEIIKHKKNGYMAKYKSSKDLINGISYIFSLNYSQLNKMKKENRKRAKEIFSLAVMVKNYIKLYDNL